MASHLGQSIANHVTLELVGGINGGFGPDKLGCGFFPAEASKPVPAVATSSSRATSSWSSPMPTGSTTTTVRATRARR